MHVFYDSDIVHLHVCLYASPCTRLNKLFYSAPSSDKDRRGSFPIIQECLSIKVELQCRYVKESSQNENRNQIWKWRHQRVITGSRYVYRLKKKYYSIIIPITGGRSYLKHFYIFIPSLFSELQIYTHICVLTRRLKLTFARIVVKDSTRRLTWKFTATHILRMRQGKISYIFRLTFNILFYFLFQDENRNDIVFLYQVQNKQTCRIFSPKYMDLNDCLPFFAWKRYLDRNNFKCDLTLFKFNSYINNTF
jgi:hypothetical protein